MNKIYLCIDLKTFFASCECAERGLSTFNDNLVVADTSRGNGTICLAITQHMKDLGIHNRCRLFEIPKDVKYIAAKPRMALYIEYSARIYEIYLRYISKDDIHPYSIDEMFLDITNYLDMYKMTAVEFAKFLMGKIDEELHIAATAGIGTNLFLCKIALDITAKHVPDRIGYLDCEKFKRELWNHTPITDFWMISRGTAKRLAKYGIYTMKQLSQYDEDILYKEFGVNAEILIDHSNGIEPVEIKDIKGYKTKSNSLSHSQVLFKDYNYKDACLVTLEMVELMSLELVDRGVVSDSIGLSICYSDNVIPPTGGSRKINFPTNVYSILKDEFLKLYKDTTLKNYPIRRIGIHFGNVISEDYEYFDLFTDEDSIKKERQLEKAINGIKNKYGKNSILKAMNLQENATTITRNKLIGGHNAYEDDDFK